METSEGEEKEGEEKEGEEKEGEEKEGEESGEGTERKEERKKKGNEGRGRNEGKMKEKKLTEEQKKGEQHSPRGGGALERSLHGCARAYRMARRQWRNGAVRRGTRRTTAATMMTMVEGVKFSAEQKTLPFGNDDVDDSGW